MTQREPATRTTDHAAIQALVVENADLERLELLLDEFNMFEAIGAVWQDSRHSDLLAFLLNPQQNHGLGDSFARKLLQRALAQAYEIPVPVSPIDLDVWDLKPIIVLRESQRIDILLLDERHRLAVIIENQLTGRGNTASLQRYWETVAQLYPGWDMLGLYLSPDGEPCPNEYYIPISYNLLCGLLEGLLDSRAATLTPDVSTMLVHYTRMLRRHIVGESEITRLCRRIYGKHQRAFDLIYEHRISRQKVIRNVVKLLIEQKQGLLLDHSQERYIGFAVQEWEVPALMDEKDGARPGRLLVFEFDTWFDTLPLSLHIVYGSEMVRQRLLDVATRHQPPFKVEETASPTKEWIKIFERPFLTTEFYEEAGSDELAEKILQNWSSFLKDDLPRMNAILAGQEWIWKGTK